MMRCECPRTSKETCGLEQTAGAGWGVVVGEEVRDVTEVGLRGRLL